MCNGPLILDDLLPTGSEETEVLEVGSIPVAIFPFRQTSEMYCIKTAYT